MSGTALYRALLSAGADEMQAKEAADDIDHILSADLATKADIYRLENKMESVKVDLLKWIMGILVAQTGIIVAMIKLLN